MTYVAFVGGSWLWGEGENMILGDMAGPFESWSAAAEYLISRWPIHDGPGGVLTAAEWHKAYADLIYPVAAPDGWVTAKFDGDAEADPDAVVVPLGDMLAATVESVGMTYDLLRVEQEHFWAAHPLTGPGVRP